MRSPARDSTSLIAMPEVSTRVARIASASTAKSSRRALRSTGRSSASSSAMPTGAAAKTVSSSTRPVRASS